MKKLVLAAAAVLAIVVGTAPSFANSDSSSIERQSANIAAGGGAYPAGVVKHFRP
jgi:hypothetical protein